MSDPRDLASPRTIDMDGIGDTFTPRPQNALAVPPAGGMVMDFQHGIITAQKIAEARNIKRLFANLKALCGAAGDRYVYSWEVNDRQNRRTVTVSGPTIKLANDLAREYGNCIVDTRVVDTPTHWHVYARFTDLESGFSMTRPFQQRKSQDTGMKDADRRADMLFQMGVSKAIRNVVVNALQTFADFMVEESEKGLVEWVEQHADKANAYIDKTLLKHNLDQRRLEAVVGRIRAQWSVKDVARMMATLRGIDEGLTIADEILPSLEDAGQVSGEKETKKTEGKKRETKPKPDKAADGKAAETAEAAKPEATKPAETAKPADPPHDPETGEIQEGGADQAPPIGTPAAVETPRQQSPAELAKAVEQQQQGNSAADSADDYLNFD